MTRRAELGVMEHGSLFEDTPPHVQALVIAGYRAMSPTQKLHRVESLNRALVALARARIRRQYGADLGERELRLRVAALHLPRETMVRIFDWDPHERGY